MRPRLAPSSLRLRLTVLATLVVTATVAVSIGVLAITLVSSARGNLSASLRSYAASLADTGPSGTWPKPLPPAPGGDPGAWAQVVAADGTVVAGTSNINGLPALYTLPPGGGAPVRTNAGPNGVSGDQIVISQPVDATGTVVYAGSSAALLTVITHDLQGHLLFALPFVLLGGATVAWLLLGRALSPVERIRAEAAAISATDLHRRIPGLEGDDELARLTRTLNEMLGRLDDSARAQRRFIADASHELRTPLTAMRTSLEVGLAHVEQAPWNDLAGRAVTETARLQRLVDALLLHARADAGTLVGELETVDLAALAQAVADALAPPGVSVVVTAAQPVSVNADADQLTRVIRNLLDNAVRYATSQVEVGVTTDGDTAVLRVADDGPGVDPADQERIFERFVRRDTARTRGTQAGSAGLGLSIARDIAVAHGGTLAMDSRSGFVLRIPRRPLA
ncbi:MAG TPA: HAMP domain-containing sensor histidine kinase [Kribbella sp.]|jgi:signal transduction histidine kinase